MAERRSGQRAVVRRGHLPPSLWSQTMNIVGQLAETVFVTVKELYRGLNPATLTGGIDVIVVRQPDGSFQCSPFHVRFGKLGVLRSREKVVDIEINGEPVDLHMKLGDNGEAFFVEQNENMEVSWTKLVKSQMLCLNGFFLHVSVCCAFSSVRSQHICAPPRFLKRPLRNRPDSPKSDSELLLKSPESSGPQMQWNWGGFPQVRSHWETRDTDHCSEERDEDSPAGGPPSEKHPAQTEGRDTGVSSATSADASSRQQDKKKGQALLYVYYLFDVFFTSFWLNIEKCSWVFIYMAEMDAGKRNQHLGPTDIYLDDLTTLEPEVAALYFPKAEAALHQGADLCSGSGSQSPQSVGSAAMDSGTEYLSDSTCYNIDISMSLCGKEGDTSQITKETFKEHLVTYQDFVSNPGIMEDPSLVICINSNYYNWAVAAPMILSMTAFQKNLPKSTVERLVKDKMSKRSGRWWFSWRRRDSESNQRLLTRTYLSLILPPLHALPTSKPTFPAAGLGRKAVIPHSLSTETVAVTQTISQLYRKSLRLTSKQIESLNLHEGANKVVFSVTTQYQGTCRCEAAIYLWSWNDRVIISDIDGTITKSDALGHILPQFGKDWTHKGIAKLYHKIHQNGYKFLYCSARAIGMAAITKGYLQWVNDQGIVLPKGPVLLAPSSLFSALHREVIEKKPEVFKVACLSDIRDLFNTHRQPFYAAFGNRTNDAYAYKQVGVSEARIFTVNPKGELIQEMAKGNKSTYSHLSELVEHFFPVRSAESNAPSVLVCPEFSSFSYWKEPLPELDMTTLL
uniref:phosphatidate phosphatase n=1 Tax=Nothobranchius furzeri TaxID=105023 RepID=A0A8C6LXL4_NOTFU